MDDKVFYILIQAFPILLIAAIVIFICARHKSERYQQLQGVLWVQAMRVLLSHVQQHRGLSSGVIGGAESLKGKLEEIQQQVSRDFEHIGSLGEWVVAHEQWRVITQHWARLAGNLSQLSVSENIAQYNRLIKNILVFVDDVTATHHLGPHSAFKSIIWRELLTLAEYIGQTRAVGTALAARSKSVEDADLSHVYKDMGLLSHDIFVTLNEPRCRSELDPDCLQEILDLLVYTDANLLRAGPIVSASEYYAESTRVLDDIYARFDEELRKVHRSLS